MMSSKKPYKDWTPEEKREYLRSLPPMKKLTPEKRRELFRWKGKDWPDRYFPEIKRVVAEDIILIEAASDFADQKHATDYIVTVQAEGFTEGFSCRVRRSRFWGLERHQGKEVCYDFTLRYSVPSGAKTELAKIREGLGRRYLFAWAKPEPDLAFRAWVFIDLDKLRASGLLENPREGSVAVKYGSYLNIPPNEDGTNFAALPLTDLCEFGCLLSAGGEAERFLDYQRAYKEAEGE